MMALILNAPYSFLGLTLAILSIPKRLGVNKVPPALVVEIKNFWWTFSYFKNARAMAIGNIVILGPSLEEGDLEHELVHVEQHQRRPLIQPFLYNWELLRKGYRNNKYEIEAYDRAGNVYKGKGRLP